MSGSVRNKLETAVLGINSGIQVRRNVILSSLVLEMTSEVSVAIGNKISDVTLALTSGAGAITKIDLGFLTFGVSISLSSSLSNRLQNLAVALPSFAQASGAIAGASFGDLSHTENMVVIRTHVGSRQTPEFDIDQQHTKILQADPVESKRAEGIVGSRKVVRVDTKRLGN